MHIIYIVAILYGLSECHVLYMWLYNCITLTAYNTGGGRYLKLGGGQKEFLPGHPCPLFDCTH